MRKTLIACTAILMMLALTAGCAVTGKITTGKSSPELQQTKEAHAADSGSPSPSVDSDPTDNAISGIVAVESDKYEYHSDYIDVTIEVPQLSGPDVSAVKDGINQIFTDIMTAAENDVKPAEEESKDLAKEQGSIYPYMIHISFSVPYNENGILSLVLSDFRYNGGAHGGEARSAYTFDLRTGRKLSLSDLMTGDSGYRDMFNRSIRQEIDRRAQAGTLTELNTFTDIGDDPAFYLTPEAVVFYFNEYDYFPYAAGIQEFPFKYDALSGMLKTEYSSLKMVPVMLDNTSDNKLSVGDIGQVRLNSDPTKGNAWHYTISDASVLELSSTQDPFMSTEDTDGGGAFVWNFRAMKPGTVTITFQYKTGDTDSAPEDDLAFTIVVQ